MAYRLFSQQKSTGRCHRAARLALSWSSPSAKAPSPKTTAVTTGRPRIASARARPTASGSPPPTIAFPP